MAEQVRLQKAISQAGLMSRRRAEDLIRAGRVRVEGRVARLGDRIDPESARVEVDGVAIPVAPGRISYLLHKPAGVISTSHDPQGRTTVVDLVPSEPRVWPVGRLDADTEGLIILSNDGELTNLVTHPSHGVAKTYVALVEGAMGRRALRRLLEGVELEDGPAQAVEATVLDRRGDRTLVRLVMREGRNREVRRMAEAVGHPVVELARTAIGPLRDRSLRPGAWRELTPEEVAGLYREAGASRAGGDEPAR